ncbi:putative biopolymer transport protein, ExbD/TolR family [Crocosphaera subtropica ATCC 51142]|uniref:Biopolymer transport protein, ExbD/TolR family n=1 Tax=Crocosphaera subtropica (strain ATCC 51142 / BH68) TaxID=43989 RepID=B1WUQ9_CROS5|nr:biopolymer transporter ExbD [Crocosphaera subtropica]ACB50510.1 putative biopolymer transport protein, ExbD/TolR family [Crocosphaera subtropica ATCC 51142]
MRFKQQRSSSVPEVNLVPMIDVLMSVLLFFIITSMTLTSQILGNINIPGIENNNNTETQDTNQPTLIIGIDKDKNLFIGEEIVTEEEMLQNVSIFLDENSSGEVIIKADQELSYQDISGLLNKLSDVSEKQVFLAIDKDS